MRYFRDDCLRPNLNFFEKSYEHFHYLRKSIDCRMKQLTQEGIGAQKMQASTVEPDDEDRLWASGAFSTTTSSGLLSATYFYICKVFGLRSRDEHRRLSMSQFEFDADNTGKYLKFTGKSSKTFSGGMDHRVVSNKIIKHYDTSSSKSTYKIVQLYLDALHRCDIFDGCDDCGQFIAVFTSSYGHQLHLQVVAKCREKG